MSIYCHFGVHHWVQSMEYVGGDRIRVRTCRCGKRQVQREQPPKPTRTIYYWEDTK